MSVDSAIREMIKAELDYQLRDLRDLAKRLSPLTSLLGGGAGRAPGRRGPGRPPGSTGRKGKPGRRTRAETGANDRPCALIGCKKTARSKGYCGAHYQKLRNLAKTNRLPSDWKEYAEPNSVQDIVLPRGRAAAKALSEAK
jgi:hypothetical protein